MEKMNIPRKYKIWRYPLFLKIRYSFKRAFRKESICLTYWIHSNTFLWSPWISSYNWGDYVNLRLAELISGKAIIPSKFVLFSPKISMMGSILPWAMDKDTIVWGSGCLNSHDPLWENVEKPMKVCAVRGPLTRNVLIEHGIDCPEIYGDPALCFPRYYQPKVRKMHRIGIIPHASNIKRGLRENIRIPGDAIIINPCEFSQWNEFVDQILSCEVIFSASLHGIIISDAYGVPNVWISFTGDEHPDNNFKFHDYFLSVGKNSESPLNANDIDFYNIRQYVRAWKKLHIDVNKLLEVCPLK